VKAERITFTKKVKGKTINHYYVAKDTKEKEKLTKEMKQKGFELTCIIPIKVL